MTENKGDLISREALRKAVINNFDNLQAYFPKGFIEEIDNAPTVSLQDIYQEGHYDGHLEGYTKAINEERPQGEWNYIQAGMCVCPFCGAQMKKGGET